MKTKRKPKRHGVALEVVKEFNARLDAYIARWQRKLLVAVRQPDGKVAVVRVGKLLDPVETKTSSKHRKGKE